MASIWINRVISEDSGARQVAPAVPLRLPNWVSMCYIHLILGVQLHCNKRRQKGKISWPKRLIRHMLNLNQSILLCGQQVVKVGEGPAQEASRRRAVHLIKKLRETERSSEAKRPNDPCSPQPRFSLPFLLQLSMGNTYPPGGRVS